jgi:hypothetical protein
MSGEHPGEHPFLPRVRAPGFTCDATRGPPVPVTLRIPDNIVPLGLAEEGALLALLLSDEALPPASSTGETPGVGGSGTPSP